VTNMAPRRPAPFPKPPSGRGEKVLPFHLIHTWGGGGGGGF
jgi:hypothetical protein